MQIRNADLDTLAADLLDAKKRASLARQAVTDLENQILSAVGAKTEGATTIRTDNFKVTTTGKVNRSLDADEVKRIYQDGDIPESIYTRLFDWQPKLNLREFRFIEMNEREYFQKLASAVTSKPAKNVVSAAPIESPEQ